MNEKKKDLLKLVGKYKYIIVVIAVGLLLLSFPSEKSEGTEALMSVGTDFDVERFEKRIEKALASCDGVGRAQVILSVESGPESVYAREASQSLREQENMTESDSDTKPSIMSEGSGRETPVIIKEVYPEFRGAMVICDGADSAAVRTKVTESVASLTGLTSDRISVMKMKN